MVQVILTRRTTPPAARPAQKAVEEIWPVKLNRVLLFIISGFNAAFTQHYILDFRHEQQK